MLKIGSMPVGKGHRAIVQSAFFRDEEELVRYLEEEKLSAEKLYEIRYDLFGVRTKDGARKVVQELSRNDIPFIFTMRGSRRTALEYAELASAAGAPAIDIDLSLLHTFRNAGSTVIVSLHAYDGFPAEDTITRMFESSAEIVKVASTFRNFSDFLHRMYCLHEIRERYDKGFAFVPMGANSSPLRALSLLISDLVYAKFNRETARGQLIYEEYATLLEILDSIRE